VDASLRAGASILADMEYSERAIYIVSGALNVADEEYEAGSMLVLTPQRAIQITATRDTRFVIVGGEPFPEARHVWWNFVSSSRARIEQAKTDWRLGRFDTVG